MHLHPPSSEHPQEAFSPQLHSLHVHPDLVGEAVCLLQDAKTQDVNKTIAKKRREYFIQLRFDTTSRKFNAFTLILSKHSLPQSVFIK